MKHEFPQNEKVEVVMKKVMPYQDALKITQTDKTKGWHMKIYQVGFYQDGIKSEIVTENNSKP